MNNVQSGLETIILHRGERQIAREYLADAKFFNHSIMHFLDDTLKVWRSVSHRYSNKERDLRIPFSLAENPKLYALDAFCIATPLVADTGQRKHIAELFTIFYLMTHFFDDHVEHPDKFFSKFDFSIDGSVDTQRGAAPFSFLLMSFSIINEILLEIDALDDNARLRIQSGMYDRLAVQTRYFISERNSNLNVNEVLEMKARRVNGEALGVLADILAEFLKFDSKQFKAMEKGLFYLGSMEQFTDDIRDISIDIALRNANIVVSAQSFGEKTGAKLLAKMYMEEFESAKVYLEPFYSKVELQTIFSLPFYPFIINKQELENGK